MDQLTKLKLKLGISLGDISQDDLLIVQQVRKLINKTVVTVSHRVRTNTVLQTNSKRSYDVEKGSVKNSYIYY